MLQLPRRAWRYLAIVVAADSAVLIAGFGRIGETPPLPTLLIFLALGALAHFVRVPSSAGQTISFSSIVHLAAIPVLGTWGAVLSASLSALFTVGRWSAPVRLFNGGQMGLSAFAAGSTFAYLGGSFHVDTVGGSGEIFTDLVAPMFVATVVHCVANGALLAWMVHSHKGVPFRVVFLGTLKEGGVTYVGYGLFGLLLAVLWGPAGVGPLSAVLVLAPLYVARWAWAQYAEEHEAYERTVRALVGAVEAKDLYTRGHNERVSRASVMIADQLGMGPDRTEMLRFAGILHDVGKIGVPTRVLRKTGRLTDEEFAAIALHPVRGLDMVRGIEFLKEAYSGILHHHERLDGRGYPMGLQGDDIPEFARIIGVADAFDSMTSTRSYRQARSVAEAVEELRRCSGTQFDPRFVDALVTALERQPWEGAPDPVADGPVDGTTAVFDHDDPSAASPVLPPVAAPPERLP